MKKLISAIALSAILVGCSTTNPNGDLANVNSHKLKLVSQLTYQENKALSKTNLPAAKSYQDKIVSIVGVPEVKDMGKTNFDSEIIALQSKEDKVNAAIIANSNKADELQAELNRYHKWFGLMAVYLGLKQFVLTSLWILLGFSVAFFVLRVLAASNPIANLVFGIFQSLAASVIHLIESLIPSSITVITQAKADVSKVESVIKEVGATIKADVITPIETHATGSITQ